MEQNYRPTLAQLRADLEAAPLTAAQAKKALLNILAKVAELERIPSDTGAEFKQDYRDLHDAIVADEIPAAIVEARDEQQYSRRWDAWWDEAQQLGLWPIVTLNEAEFREDADNAEDGDDEDAALIKRTSDEALAEACGVVWERDYGDWYADVKEAVIERLREQEDDDG